MRRIFWSRRRGPRPGRSSTSPWAACLGFGCAGGASQGYLTRYCAVGQLHRAASVGAVATVERFLTFRVNGVNDPDKRNRTALHYACAHGHLGVVTLLIERNCDIDARDDNNCTPLIKASQHQHEDCVLALLQHGAEPNAVDALGNTALHYAVHSENTVIASQLLEHSANIEAKTKKLRHSLNENALKELIIKGTDTFKGFSEATGFFDARIANSSGTLNLLKEGFTPLSLALRQNKDLIVELLIEKGANIHTVFHRDRRSWRFRPDGSRQTTDDNNVDTKDEVALKTSPPSQKASKAKKTSLPPDHLQITSQAQKEKRKCDTGHRPAHSGRAPTETAKGAPPSEQLNKVLRHKLRTFPEPSGKEPPSCTSKGKAHLKVEEERKYGLQELGVARENSDDRSACAVASASAAAAAVSASTSAKSASTSASAASNIASAALASASAASTSASVAFTSASAASTSAASASASASDASAAAAAASASASDASAAAAAAASAAAASAVASSNATVNTVVAAAVTAAFAAVTATADCKGNEPTPQRRSGATTNDKDFALMEKEEHDKSEPTTHLMEMNRSENKNCFPRDTIPTFGKCSADTSAVHQVKQTCAHQLHQDEQSPAKSPSKEKHEAKKQMNGVEGLEDGTLPREAASEDYRDSGCLLGLCDELYLCKRLLEIKDSCGDVLRREIKKMETKHGGAHQELSKITKVLSQLEQQETEDLCNLRSSLKQNEKLINDVCPDGIVKTELRGGERQYYEAFGRQLWSSLYHPCYNEEFEVSQHEMFLGNLNMNLKALHNSVAQFQEAQLQEDRQREGVLSSARMEHLLWKLEVECLKLEDSVKNQAEEIEVIENQLLREDLTGDRKKEQNEATQSTQSLVCALEQEMEKSEELEKELCGFMDVLKITGKKLDECENRELYFYEDMKNKTFEMLQHEINYLKDTWEPIHCKYLHQDINIQLTEQELLKIKTEQENYEHLHKTQGDVEKDVLTLKGLVQESMIQAEEEKKLEKVRENNNNSRMSQMILRVKGLESRLPEIKSQADSTRREMEKYKQLCEEENKSRKSLSNTLNKTMEKLEVSKTKLMQLDQQKVTLETILSLLPAQQHLHVAKFNPTVGHNPRFPPRDASCLPASEPQPVFESKRKGLSRRQMGLAKHMTVEVEEDSAPVDPWSFEASPL